MNKVEEHSRMILDINIGLHMHEDAPVLLLEIADRIKEVQEEALKTLRVLEENVRSTETFGDQKHRCPWSGASH